MKLYNNQNKIITYKHNNEEINIPEYIYKDEDIRGCWIASVSNMDIPICQDIKEYQNYLISILENMKSYNMNTAIFHIRPCNDAFYPSKLNPWSKYITGIEGKDPGFDVFDFFIREAKKRNIKVHAWLNPYRVSKEKLNEIELTKDEYLDTLAENNFARVHREHTILDGASKIILRPGHKEVVDFLIETVKEIVENYDIEAIHMDDFFYPYDPVSNDDELEDYLKYRTSENQTMKEWRISNVDTLIERIHQTLKEIYICTGKKVEFGISPFPIYRTHSSILETGWEKGSYNSKGCFQCYDGQYSDIYKWMKEGWIDYVVPQDYFSFSRTDASYHDICWWWSNICKETNTKLYMGQAIYHLGETNTKYSDTWQDKNEIHNQISFNCNFDNIKGVIFFRYSSLVKGENEILNQGLDILKKDWKKRHNVIAGIIKKDNKIFCCQRGPKKDCAYKWEFPGGKIEKGETHEQALVREIKEELGCLVKVNELITVVKHEYENYFVTLNVYACEVIDGTPKNLEHIDFKWCEKERLKELDFVEADYQFLDLLMK